MTRIELLRHTEAVGRDRWWGRPERERPLTGAGRARAQRVAAELADLGVDAIRTSPFVRCVETVEPLGAALGLEVVTDERLAEASTLPVLDGGNAWVASAWLAGRALGLVDELAGGAAGARVVLCSHGDVIPALLANLAGRDGLDLTDVRCRKGARVTLTFRDGRCVAAEPHPAPR